MITRYYLICTFLCVTCITNAQVSALTVAADSLYRNMQYAGAAIAYERVLFSATDPAEVYDAVNGKLQCLKQQRLFGGAVSFIRMNLTDRLPDSVRRHLLDEQLLCSYLAGNYTDALAVAAQLDVLFPAQQNNRQALIRILCLNELQRWKEAASVYAAITRNLPAGSYPDPYRHLPRLKNIDKAQWLSTFIPGAGQWYAGRPLEALASVVLQGAGIYFGVTSFLDHYYLSAWLAGAGLTGSFHMGGVRRSAFLARQYNKRHADRFNRTVNKQVIETLR